MNLPPLINFLRSIVPLGHEFDVAKKVGIHTVTINNWLAGKTDPRLSLFEASLNAVGHKLVIEPIEKDDDKVLQAISRLQNSVKADFTTGGGLQSDETIRASDELRLQLSRAGKTL